MDEIFRCLTVCERMFADARQDQSSGVFLDLYRVRGAVTSCEAQPLGRTQFNLITAAEDMSVDRLIRAYADQTHFAPV